MFNAKIIISIAAALIFRPGTFVRNKSTSEVETRGNTLSLEASNNRGTGGMKKKTSDLVHQIDVTM